MPTWLAVVLTGLLTSPASLDRMIEVRSDALNPSAVCGQCHGEIHEMWRRSMHSLSYTDPIFEASYMKAYLETQGQARKVCLRCHAPMAAMDGTGPMDESAMKEGIGCDYCHSIVAVNLERRDRPIEIRIDGVKRGPLRYTESPAHEVARSELHESSLLCAGCHEYTTPEGVPVLTTYSEWRVSPQAAQGKTCQHCHMPSTPGATVRPELGVHRDTINLHSVSGMHSTEQVRKAAAARLLKVAREQPEVAAVEVEVTNVGSGHCIPTGLPSRKLILEVVLYVDGRETRRFERVYQRVLLDEKGQPITEDHRLLLSPRKVLQDNRLAAGERRVERWVASVPPKGRLHAEISFRYSYEPLVLSRQPITIDLLAEGSP